MTSNNNYGIGSTHDFKMAGIQANTLLDVCIGYQIVIIPQPNNINRQAIGVQSNAIAHLPTLFKTYEDRERT